MKGERKNVQFARFSRRLTTEGLLKALLIVLAISFSIVFVVAAVAWYTESNVLWLCIGIVAAIALIGIPVIYFAFYRPTIQSNARRIDRLGLEERMVTMVEQESPKTVADYKARLQQKMREVLENTSVDEARILTEAAIFADKVAVDEETVRLRSHIAQMNELIESNVPVGRKLDFLVQEMNRETNTIGSKCQNAAIAHVVVDIKAEIEKIREQIQNIE